MKYYGHAEQVAQSIVEAFKTGDVGKALAPVFIHRKDNVPCRAWSWGNQLMCVFAGTNDARGFQQWKEVERSVKKGAKAFYILAPMTRKTKDKDGNEGFAVFGFKSVPVFRIADTEGAELPAVDTEVTTWLESLPLIGVAKAWGLNVDAYNGMEGRMHGKFWRKTNAFTDEVMSQGIALGVKNLSTWAHEMIHAADFRLGNLKEKGQHWRSETVAELGATILLECLEMPNESDKGGAWNYIQNYALAAEIEPLAACMDVLKRTCDAVNLILTTAEALNAVPQDSAKLAA